ncbi:MAG: Gfo/Idh/MocA family oxidoreductase [Acidobacteria bacterium]|nr:Gfo/Idh/MocA family oxidoreductase [Acidobacteriota bacterium]
MPANSPISVAVVGVGAFGRNHARVYHQLARESGSVRLEGVVDENSARREAVAREFGCRAFPSIEELIADGKVQAASVAVPTLHHLAVARHLIEAGIDVLVEKPLASSLAEADELIAAVNRHGRIAQVGHLERFNPAVRATVPLLTKPMFFEVHRLSVFTPRSLDVDVVLDLMIHDLDAVLSFVDSPVKEIRAAGLPILSNKVDIANTRIEFESGCIANFTASRVSTERVRKLRFFQPRQYISIDYSRQEVLVFTVGTGEGVPSANPEIKVSRPEIRPEEPLHAEIRSFLQAVATRGKAMIPLEDGRRALAVALEVLDEIERHRERLNLAG